MKKIIGFVLVTFLCLSIAIPAQAQNRSERQELERILTAFPEAGPGMIRHVIFLERKNNESQFKIEIIPGRNMTVDCNRHFLIGTLEERDLQGWGYTYFEFISDGQTRSTMMACNRPDQVRFIYGQSMFTRYNSRLPIVVYTPIGFDIRYQIWQPGNERMATIR